MNKNGPVFVIEDDEDDRLLLGLVFRKLAYPNKIRYFPDGQEALDFLEATSEFPLLILSDINIPKLDGFDSRQKIHLDAQLQVKCSLSILLHRYYSANGDRCLQLIGKRLFCQTD